MTAMTSDVGAVGTAPAAGAPAAGARSSVPVLSRRQRLRDATTEEIKAIARRLMAEEGTASLNLRAIAREMGMTPSALYRYFDSRDAILGALISDACEDIGEAVERAVEELPHADIATAILAACHAFRRWALDHPQEFGLIYGAPVPGYDRQAEQAAPAAMRTGMVLLHLLHRGIDEGVVRLQSEDSVPDAMRPVLAEFVAMKGHDGLPLAGAMIAVQFWVVLLGLLSGEVFGHLMPPILAHGEQFFDFSLRRAMVAVGADPAVVEASASPS